MTTITDPTAIAAVRSAYDQHNWQAAYKAVLNAITTITLVPDGSGLLIQGPASGVDPAVWTWIAGAVNVNGNSGAFASYIRDYTAEQYLVRTGIALDTGTTGPIQVASDKICQRFILDLFGQLSDPNQQNLPATIPDGTYDSLMLPDLREIGAIDAGAAASEIFELPTNDYSPWAGTVLFAQIGEDSFFKDWILTTDKVSGFKIEPGTYDLATVAKVTADQSTPGFALRILVNNELSTALQVQALGADAVADARSAADTFFDQTYGLTGNVIDIGYDIFSVGPLFALPRSATYIVGQLGDDRALAAIDGQEFVNAGRGDDTIIGAYNFGVENPGLSVIDGGDGIDTIDYSSISEKIEVNFDSAGTLGRRAIVDKGVGDVLGPHTDFVYEVEKIKLGSGADKVTLSPGVDYGSLKEIDAGANPSGAEDVIDLSQLGSGYSLANGALVGNGANVKLTNFEKVIGLQTADKIILNGSSFTDVHGGAGDDTIIGKTPDWPGASQFLGRIRAVGSDIVAGASFERCVYALERWASSHFDLKGIATADRNGMAVYAVPRDLAGNGEETTFANHRIGITKDGCRVLASTYVRQPQTNEDWHGLAQRTVILRLRVLLNPAVRLHRSPAKSRHSIIIFDRNSLN